MPPLAILVFNVGSSSIKFSVYISGEPFALLYDGEASAITKKGANLTFFAVNGTIRSPIQIEIAEEDLRSFPNALAKIVAIMEAEGVPYPDAVGHRIVHSGPELKSNQKISQHVLAKLEASIPFAPLHQPIAIEIIRESIRHFPKINNYACFDTIFHQDMPAVASMYPLPHEYREKGLRRYGFHGISCESILKEFEDGRVTEAKSKTSIPPRTIIAHLGSGASVTALKDGKSIDTTMGLTPCGGLEMGTRSGDLDPGLIICLLRAHKDPAISPAEAIEELLNRHSGLLALSDLSYDTRALRMAAAEGNGQAKLAMESFTLGAKKKIGGFIALLGGVDALIFSGGIGENDHVSRSEICSGLNAFGVTIDPKKNVSSATGSRLISATGSPTQIFVIPSEEDRMIARHVTCIDLAGLNWSRFNVNLGLERGRKWAESILKRKRLFSTFERLSLKWVRV